MLEHTPGMGRMTLDDYNLRAIGDDIRDEIARAAIYPPFNSAHEGYAVILEEMDELKNHVWMKQKNRNVVEMRKEAIQVAAMAVKFVQMLDATKGRK